MRRIAALALLLSVGLAVPASASDAGIRVCTPTMAGYYYCVSLS